MFAYLVNEREFEKGFGSNLLDQYLFPNQELAIQFCHAYDLKENQLPHVPDYYIAQIYQGKIEINKEQFEQHRYQGNLIEMPEWNFK